AAITLRRERCTFERDVQTARTHRAFLRPEIALREQRIFLQDRWLARTVVLFEVQYIRCRRPGPAASGRYFQKDVEETRDAEAAIYLVDNRAPDRGARGAFAKADVWRQLPTQDF